MLALADAESLQFRFIENELGANHYHFPGGEFKSGPNADQGKKYGYDPYVKFNG